MKHFSNGEWIDFVNGAVPTERRDLMQEHLDSGCKRCAHATAIWQRVRQTAEAESQFQPPDGIVRTVKAAFAAQAKKGRGYRVVTLFDSLLSPAPAGARSNMARSRHVLYQAGIYLLDLQVSQKPEVGKTSVTGQLLNSADAERPLSGITVVISNIRGDLVSATTNEFGEFQGDVTATGNLEIRLPSPEGKEIHVSLRESLEDKFPGSKGSHAKR